MQFVKSKFLIFSYIFQMFVFYFPPFGFQIKTFLIAQKFSTR